MLHILLLTGWINCESITVCARTHRFIFLVIIHFGVGRTCNWQVKVGNFLNVLDFIRIWFMPTLQYIITIQGATYYIMIIYYKVFAPFIFKVVFLNANVKIITCESPAISEPMFTNLTPALNIQLWKQNTTTRGTRAKRHRKLYYHEHSSASAFDERWRRLELSNSNKN